MILSQLQNNYLWKNLSLIIALMLCTVGGSLITVFLGYLAIPLATGVLILYVMWAWQEDFFWYLLLTTLLGYMFFSKGFAYVGKYPIFISELVLMSGIITMFIVILRKGIKSLNFHRIFNLQYGLLILFLIWNFGVASMHVSTYRFDALRDAMVFGYALYAILITLLIPDSFIDSFFSFFGKILPFALLWFPFMTIISRVELIPFRLPGSPIPFLSAKGSEIGVHLAGVGIFLLLQLHANNKEKFWWHRFSWLLWVAWIISVAIVGAFSRGDVLAAIVGVGIAVILRPKSSWYRPIVIIFTGIWLLLVTNWYSTLSVDVGSDREISAEQIVDNFASILGQGDNSSGKLEVTKQWRLIWWNKIIDYTFFGDYFWTGKGYGINLAIADGAYSVRLAEEKGTRSPHNGHLTILARSGVVGFMLWLSFLGSVFFRLFYIAVSNSRENIARANKAIWLLGYLMAFCVAASFDVFLESPMGGIWFWCLIGITLAYFSQEKRAKNMPQLQYRAY